MRSIIADSGSIMEHNRTYLGATRIRITAHSISIGQRPWHAAMARLGGLYKVVKRYYIFWSVYPSRIEIVVDHLAGI